MEAGVTREQAWELLRKYNQEPFRLEHALTVEHVMRWYAQQIGEDLDFWGLVGLLHDVDFEKYPEEHCVKAPELMAEIGCSPELVHGVCSHGYGLVCQVKPEAEMEKFLFAADELTGLIGAAVKMRPSKSVMDLEVSSLKKKFKDKRFAAGCSRDVIRQGAQMLGWELETLMEKTILAMRSCEEEIRKSVSSL
ncbi:MAG TPA: hydrolase [Candidatus Egerieimonas intestinavium]|uniref:Hydrolase n=1 Tax=Candidatus Egerieimonas intestinavium TaxID=2840777 RepID=A0A9D1JFW2_9FIRM|nr:hydrolase [Candidatus Egerieimonas intestinavium]